MFRRRVSSLCCTWALLAVGCAAPKPAGVREVSVHEFVFGAFGGRAVDAREMCEARALKGFELARSATDYVLSLLSLGVYTPHRVRIRCAEPLLP